MRSRQRGWGRVRACWWSMVPACWSRRATSCAACRASRGRGHRHRSRGRIQQALARGDRLASVGVMSAQVAHEINNPLTTVLGYAKLLQEDKPDGHPDRVALEMIASEAERMKGIVGSLLEYARTPRQSERGVAASSGGDRSNTKHHQEASSEPEAVVRHVGPLLGPHRK